VSQQLVRTVEFGLLVWSTGLAPNPLIASISELAKDEKTSRYISSTVIPAGESDEFQKFPVFSPMIISM
jgi:NADH dehydrogenase FAD-containing subunit